MKRDLASQRQVDAARPGLSTWLAANAGSGKTRVLTDRVARLLLDGVAPEHILCLTYTKAAATEMQNRLFKRLGSWAMLDGTALREELRQLGVEQSLDDNFLREARTLFARAIETPGGLRIQTIHSFCASLLRRFPLEAQVSPQFQEMEDRAAELLRAEILDRMAEGPQAELVHAIAPFLQEDNTAGFLAELCRFREAFATSRSKPAINAAYGLDPAADEQSILAQAFLGSEQALFAALHPFLTEGGATDKKAANELSSFTPDRAGFELLKQACLTQKGTIRKNFPTKKVRGNAPDLVAQLDQLLNRLLETDDQLRALTAAQKDNILARFAQAFLPAYEAEKTRRGWLDFDDLITRARDLLSDTAVAAWVLYRLDGGIDHILVDEAQDTSPVQWQVIERLAQEFTSGDGARGDVRRTIFVVGDKKQSIYSFQGADPSEFDRMRAEFSARLHNTDAPLNPMSLEYSFRSADPILRLADNTFTHAAASGFVADQKHIAFKDQMPGRVDLWPVIAPVADETDGSWYEPVDRVAQTHHTVILAKRVARFIRQTIDTQTPLPVEIGHSGTYEARPVHAGDFLVLVRSRSRLFTEIIRACKQEGLPIAGADRLKVMAELAVRDIIALLSFLATPEDDLALATALRSPLFGISEQQLFDLAHRRGGAYLWESLRDRSAEFPDIKAVLDDLRGQTDFLRPYDLIARLLIRHDGRKRLIARLGPEAEDGLNALLGQALAYERTEVPSLTGFLHWAQADNLEIKRAPDAAGKTLRVMTVHGSKGLEAPIVILPDCANTRNTQRDMILADAQGAMWKQAKDQQPNRQSEAAGAAQEKDAQERDRLLYVALTRAEKWLILAAAGDLGKQGNTWYDQVSRGMQACGPVEHLFDFGDLGQDLGHRLEHLSWDDLALKSVEPEKYEAPEIPDYLSHPAPSPQSGPLILSPSDLGGAKALPGAAGDSEETAKARGSLIHILLEWLAPLPQEARQDAAITLLDRAKAQTAPDLDDMTAQACSAEALSVLSAPGLAQFFDQDSLAEVPITADISGLGRIHGVIDRLLIREDHVLAVDFKSNRTLPHSPNEVPVGVLRQMAAYAAALAQVFPDHQIKTGLVWTAGPHYMALPHDLVTQSLAHCPTP